MKRLFVFEMMYILLSMTSLVYKTTLMNATTIGSHQFTDRENELLYGNVKKVTMKDEYGTTIVMEFNIKGNYSSVYSNDGHNPLARKFSRYAIEGRIINNYPDDFFIVAFRASALHVPFWLSGLSKKNKFFYNTEGKLEKIILGDGTVFNYYYDDSGYLIKRSEDDLPTLKLSWANGYISGFYMYRRNGECAYCHEISKEGNRLSYRKGMYNPSIIEFDNKGRITKSIQWVSTSETRFYEYNNEGLLNTETIIFNGNRIICRYKYDKYKNILGYEVNNTNKNDTSIYQMEYIYDDNGNWITKDTYEIIKKDIELKNKIHSDRRTIEYY